MQPALTLMHLLLIMNPGDPVNLLTGNRLGQCVFIHLPSRSLCEARRQKMAPLGRILAHLGAFLAHVGAVWARRGALMDNKNHPKTAFSGQKSTFSGFFNKSPGFWPFFAQFQVSSPYISYTLRWTGRSSVNDG